MVECCELHKFGKIMKDIGEIKVISILCLIIGGLLIYFNILLSIIFFAIGGIFYIGVSHFAESIEKQIATAVKQ